MYFATQLTLSGIEVVNIKDEIDKILKDYLLELRKNWAFANKIVIRISQIESRILSINPKIIDIKGTKINGYEKNLEIDLYEIPIWGDGNYEKS